ncbi:VOC family metalloprotein YjdN [Enterobacteriaceae bacterium H18W14]|uniref:VOC family metalloprotein YjdN n=1 Tax=Dryocola boscaweniae TaxID=2925397 RepID=UPI0022F073B9|nr:VOC family metalloprotein YjdN [Dryocola boscaweniae]MCT4715262.1 VOC family metalloprotein YjdN [Dryocola boscaweniae]
MSVSPYIFFDGTCEEAIAFYQQAIGAQLLFKMTFGEMPNEEESSEDCASGFNWPDDKIMHANVRIGDNEVMMSDGNMCADRVKHTGYALSLATKDLAQGQSWFDNLAAGGDVTMPWGETFWAKGFGMLTDKYGIPWMINVEKPM